MNPANPIRMNPQNCTEIMGKRKSLPLYLNLASPEPPASAGHHVEPDHEDKRGEGRAKNGYKAK